MSAIHGLVLNPSKINSSTLNDVNHNYCALLWQSQIVIEDGLLIYHKPMHGGSSYTRFQLVPLEFYNIIFIAFHSNATGSHFNAYCTLHCIHLRYYWLEIYSYINCMCNACPGCALANPIKSKSSKLVYNFSIEVPFLVLFVGAYSARKHSSFDGFDTYLVTCCGMTSFASMEPIQHANSKNFASAIMRTQLRYGFCHTIVLDKDSKFYSICQEALDLLQINYHVLSGDNHNPMMVERVNWFRIPHMPPAGSLKVLHAPAGQGGIRCASQTKIYNLETDEFVSNPSFLKTNLAGVISQPHFGENK
jgi:hypothetical protein